MRIGVIVPGFSKDEEDWCIPALLNLVKKLSALAEIVVFALRYPHDRGTYFVHTAKVHAFGGADLRGMKRVSIIKGAVDKIRAEHSLKPFDLLHAFWAHEPGLVACIAGRKLSLPIVVSLMGGELAGLKEINYGHQLNLINRKMIDHSLRRAHKITVGSQYLRDILAGRLLKPETKRVCDLPLGVDSQLFRPNYDRRERAGPEIRLLHVGSLIPVKNQRSLLQAFELICKGRTAHLDLIGDGPMLGELKRLASALNISDGVTFHKEIAHHDLVEHYQMADLLVTSSLFESQGMVVLEAGACGLPVVGTAVGILPELEPAAKCYPIENREGFANVIGRLLASPASLERMSTSIRAKIKKYYSVDSTVERLIQIYNSL